MPPKRLGNDFKTIRVHCNNGHEVARYRKPRSEWGERTHKLWLVEERLGRLVTEPPILGENEKTQEPELTVPPLGVPVVCGADGCRLEIGTIKMVGGTVALVLNKGNLQPTKG